MRLLVTVQNRKKKNHISAILYFTPNPLIQVSTKLLPSSPSWHLCC